MGLFDGLLNDISRAHGIENVLSNEETPKQEKARKSVSDQIRFKFDIPKFGYQQIYFYTKDKSFAELIQRRGRAFAERVSSALHVSMEREDLIFCEYVLVTYVEFRRQQFNFSLSEKDKHDAFQSMLRFWVSVYRSAPEIRNVKKSLLAAEFATKFKEYYELNRERAYSGNKDTGLIRRFSENVCKLADGVYIQGYERDRSVTHDEYNAVYQLATVALGF